MKQCFKVIEKATGHKIVIDVPQGEPQYRVSAQTACEYISLFSTLAKAAGKNLTVDSFGKAIEKTKTVDVTGSGHDDLRPEDAHLLVADVHLHLRPRAQAARGEAADRLTVTGTLETSV